MCAGRRPGPSTRAGRERRCGPPGRTCRSRARPGVGRASLPSILSIQGSADAGRSGKLERMPGLVPRGSIAWRVGEESVLTLGGGRALILQVAQPQVAAGVEQHSNYRREPWQRLQRTISVTQRIVFGDSESSERAAGGLRRVHERVEGEDQRGRPYRALDPELLMWVHATLIDTSLRVYDRYVRP